MKVGILTLSESDNYGALLQSYALQTAISKLDAESEVLRFEKKEEKKNESDTKIPAFASMIQNQAKKRAELFENFRKEFLKTSEKMSNKDLEKLNEVYDLFIVGSDQVWNLEVPEVDAKYFLPFAEPQKRFSYAASFGTSTFPEKMKDWCGNELSKFKNISVREESGRKIIKEIANRDCCVTVDPVLLLDSEEWNKLLYKSEEKEKYVLLFMLSYDEELAKKAEDYANKKGLKVCVVNATFIPKYGMDSWSGVDVRKWLTLIKNAEAVFCNSFHCLVFSAIFEKKVSIEFLKKELKSRNGRLEEFLENIHLMECIKEPMSISKDKFDEYMKEKKNNSLEYLRRVLKNG